MCSQISSLRYVNIYVTKLTSKEDCAGDFIDDWDINKKGYNFEFADSTENEVGL